MGKACTSVYSFVRVKDFGDLVGCLWVAYSHQSEN